MAADPVQKIIKAAVKRGASDLHVKAGDVFRARIDGKLVPLTKQRLTPDQTRAIALQLIPNEEDRSRIDQLWDYDCSWGMPGVGRFRVNLLRQRSSFMIVMRVIPFAVPSMESLGVPDVLKPLLEKKRGLIIVSGASGGGKSSTMASMVHHLNTSTEKHVVTIESPIEYLHRDMKSSVTQRDVGIDTASVLDGIQAALRQDPDVIVIGDLPESETLDTGIRAAEMGHLVIGGLSTPNVASTISRMLAMFPAEERDVARARLGDVLLVVAAQQLLPRKDGDGRVPLFEVLISTDEVRGWIRERGTPADLEAIMAADKTKTGMMTFDAEVKRLVKAGDITAESAQAVSAKPVKRATRARRRSSSTRKDT